MAPRAAATAALARTPVPVGDLEVAALMQQLSAVASRAKRLGRDFERGAPPSGDIAGLLVAFCYEASGVVFALGQLRAQADEHAAQVDATANSNTPLASGAARREQADLSQRDQATGWHDEVVMTQLDAIAQAAIVVMRALGRGGGGERIAAGLHFLEGGARDLGWTVPASVEEAQGRSRAHEPCDSDAASGADAARVNPQDCYLSESDRSGKQNELNRALATLATRFTAAIKHHTKRLQAAIDRDRKLAEAIANAILDALVIAATGGLGKAGVASLRAASTLAPAVGGKVREAMIELVVKVGSDAIKTTMKNSATLTGPSEDDERDKTIAFAETLDHANGAGLDQIGHDATRFDDATLELVIVALERVTPAEIEARLGPVIHAFESQIQPLGASRTSLELTSLRRRTNRAARLALPDGEIAYALVTHSVDVSGVTDAARIVKTTAREVGRQIDGPHLLDGVDRERDLATLRESSTEIEFVRWITTPAGTTVDFHALVSGDALDVPLERVKDLPLFGPAGQRLR